ncbi:MAG TPA: hypothetical protein EYP34_08465 [Chromatiaceae bacterium]|nr:hypothetical protein [Chromatiaceae bacterium]
MAAFLLAVFLLAVFFLVGRFLETFFFATFFLVAFGAAFGSFSAFVLLVLRETVSFILLAPSASLSPTLSTPFLIDLRASSSL